MKTLFAALLLLSAALLIGANPQPCAAGWCPTYKCYGPCGTCACMSTDYRGGTCVDIDSVSRLQDEGWVLLP